MSETEEKTKSRKLGRRQREVLELIKNEGEYRKKGEWKYNSHSETVEILLSLKDKGYVSSRTEGDDDTLVFSFIKEPEYEAPYQVAPTAAEQALSQTADADAVEGYPNAELVTP